MSPEKITLLLLALATCIFSGYAKPPRKIINGTEASNIPYQVSITTSVGMHICGGSIIDETHILTAAHCVMYMGVSSAAWYRVVIGTNDRFNYSESNQYEIARIIVHEAYNPNDTWKNDIAILELEKNITFTEYQQPIALPSKNTTEGTLVMISGWGITERHNPWSLARYLKKLWQRVISREECQRIMTSLTIHEGHICAWARGQGSVCTYDSGGPLVDGSSLVGIASFNEYCKPAYPDVYTHVYHYVPWIQKTIAESILDVENNFDIRK